MPATEREMVEAELEEARRLLANVEDPARQTEETPAGQDYRRRLRADIEHLEARLSSEDV